MDFPRDGSARSQALALARNSAPLIFKAAAICTKVRARAFFPAHDAAIIVRTDAGRFGEILLAQPLRFALNTNGRAQNKLKSPKLFGGSLKAGFIFN